jgi:hypothetical protein
MPSTTSPCLKSPLATPLTSAILKRSARAMSKVGSEMVGSPIASMTCRCASLATACTSFLRAVERAFTRSSGSGRSPM